LNFRRVDSGATLDRKIAKDPARGVTTASTVRRRNWRCRRADRQRIPSAFSFVAYPERKRWAPYKPVSRMGVGGGGIAAVVRQLVKLPQA
jgi:hypothetical protein